MKKQIPMDSAQWGQLDRQVQVTTGKSSVKLISAFKFEDMNQGADNNWIKNSKDKVWIDAVFNVTDFSK